MKNILIITIILFIFSLVFYFYDKLKKIYRKKVLNLSFWRDRNENHHNELLQFINEIIPYLEKWKVRYWAHAGTLLGCVRHGGFIPWDDDIDFGYIDDGNIEDLKNDLINNDYKIGYGKLNIFYKCGFKIESNYNKNLWIDMFTFTKENDMLKQTKAAELIWPKENYYYDEVFPLKNGKFNDINIPIPNDPDKFCSRAFGNNYISTFYINLPHLFNNIIEVIIITSISKEKFYMKDLIDE